jgi:hypothetical protein
MTTAKLAASATALVLVTAAFTYFLTNDDDTPINPAQLPYKVYSINVSNTPGGIPTIFFNANTYLINGNTTNTPAGCCFYIAHGNISDDDGIAIDPHAQLYGQGLSGLCPDNCDLTHQCAVATSPNNYALGSVYDGYINNAANGDNVNAFQLNSVDIISLIHSGANTILIYVFETNLNFGVMYQGFAYPATPGGQVFSYAPLIDDDPTFFIDAAISH